jgi:hypothetical protein
MTLDNRTNEMTEAQIEAAARVIWEMDNTTLGIKPPESLEAWEEETEGYLELARAALVAAQEAAPQAGHTDLIAKTFNEIHGDRRSFSPAQVKQIVYPLIDALRAPVLAGKEKNE